MRFDMRYIDMHGTSHNLDGDKTCNVHRAMELQRKYIKFAKRESERTLKDVFYCLKEFSGREERLFSEYRFFCIPITDKDYEKIVKKYSEDFWIGIIKYDRLGK